MASSAALTTTHLPRLRSLIKDWERKQPPAKGFKFQVDVVKDTTVAEDARSKEVVVAFRTRPPLENEAENKFTNSVANDAGERGGTGLNDDEATDGRLDFCAGISVPSAEPGIFVAHVPGMKWSGPTLTHKAYDADLAFGPGIDNEEVYQRTVTLNGLLPLVLSGGIGCILAYGQTGSGKTFTMEGLEHRIARDLFDVAKTVGKRIAAGSSENADANSDGSGVFEFSVTFLELLGRYATDLVAPSADVDERGNPVRKEVPIREDKIGDVIPGLVSTHISSSAELEALIVSSLAHRRTSATLRNATSSRSHALLTIRVKNTLFPYAKEGQLILVDLAGSERHEDSKLHDKTRMDESRENNMSLMNLKECVKAKAKMAQQDGFVHIPWRSNKLTMLLKPIFDVESRQPSRTIIIAHVSPHIQDTTHSTNTLSYASPFKTSPPKLRGPAPFDEKDPRTWEHAYTASWLAEQFQTRTKAAKKAEWNVKAQHAKAANKTLKPFDEDAPVDVPLDMAILCPEGVTAAFFARMYTVEFVEWCSKAAVGAAGMRAIKDMAMDVISLLFYMVIKAKTRSRNEVMKSRKKINLALSYGKGPELSIPGSEETYDVEEFDFGEIYEARTFHGNDVWMKMTNDAIRKAESEGGWVDGAKKAATRQLIDMWKAEMAKKEEMARKGMDSLKVA